MLTDPLYIRRCPDPISPNTAVPTGSTSVQGVISVKDRVVERQSRSADDYSVIISHSISNENPGVVTDRSLVRFNSKFVDSTSGKLLTMSAYAVLAFPRAVGHDVGEIQALTRELGYFLLYGEVTSGGAAVVDSTALSRIIGGEG